MRLHLQPGKYIVAVSGGVDSVVLLDILASVPDVELVVAHFDHGIRSDSDEDEEFVRALAEKYGLKYESEEGQLGSGASEEQARNARYDFLRRVQNKYHADGVVTAHHQDDLIETTLINLLRGTGRRGLHSIANAGGLVRPMLHLTKAELKRYAETHNIEWREDSTNSESVYLRNKIRHKVLARADRTWRQEMLQRIQNAADINDRLDREINTLLQQKILRGNVTFGRIWFVKLPHAVAAELVAALLRYLRVSDVDHRTIERLVVAIKAAKIGSKIDIDKHHYLLITKRSARVMDRQLNKTIKA